LYYLGGTISHFEIIEGILWPEAAVGAWFSENNHFPIEDSFGSSMRDFNGYFGMEESVTLVLGKNHFTRESQFRPHPQIGVGGTWHQVWLTNKEAIPFVQKTFATQQNETSWRLLLRIVIPLRETRQLTAEWEWNRNFDGYYPHDRNANYILKLGYRFRAF
jgi:hypothetical protein